MTLRIILNDDSVQEYKGVCSFYGGTACGELVLKFTVGLVTLDFSKIKTIEFIKGV